MNRLIFVMLTLVSTAATARGDPVVASSSTTPTRRPESPDTPAVQPRPIPRELTAADVRDAPIPGDEGGQLTALDPGDSAFRVAARGVLFIPKLVIAAALSPVRGAIWADDRYRLEDLYDRVFYNADRTIGLFPTATYTSGFGVAAGAGFVDRQLFGEHESLALEATTGAVTRLDRAELDRELATVRHDPDGQIRALASRWIDGVTLGGHPGEGVRQDDRNDRIPHELRRDLRGQYPIYAWLDAVDVTEGQYVDTWIADPGDHHRHYVKHYAIDFGKSLGAMGEIGFDWWRGAYYRIDLAEMVRTFFTAGLSARPWEDREAPRLRGVSSLFEARTFDPGSWHPDSPGYLPFLTSDRFDKFWGAKIVARLTRDQIHAGVEAGRFSDPRSIEYLTDTLVTRQRTTVAYWFARVNPLDHFSISSALDHHEICFDDLAITAHLVPSNLTRYAITSYDFGGRQIEARENDAENGGHTCAALELEPGTDDGGYTIVRISTMRSSFTGDTFIHVARDPRSQVARVVGVWRP